MKTAVLVDGGFYRKKAAHFWGHKSPHARACELIAYCHAHIDHEKQHSDMSLYRIFYYDCPPISSSLFHPLLKKSIDFRHSETYSWTNDFFDELRKMRKVALRLGTISEQFSQYEISHSALKKLCAGKITIDNLSEKDFSPSIKQKGVDMKIGIDIASLAYKKQVNQIILIAGDSDFVPAAKLARREGIDFILDPMWSKVKPDLFEHIDGLHSNWKPKD